MSYFGIEFKDYAQPVNRPLIRRWIARHRLERANPADPRSPILKPIVFYVDRGIPSRSAPPRWREPGSGSRRSTRPGSRVASG